MLRRGFKQMLAEANAVIESVSVQDFAYLVDDPEVIVVDIRETEERQIDGFIPGSVHAPRGLLEFKVDPESSIYNSAFDPERHLILYCGTGGRSALAAKTLLDMGFSNVSTLAGGYDAWRVANS